MKVTLLYPPNQSWPGTMCKPNSSLAYPYLAGALIEKGIEVKIFDACAEGFDNSALMPNGMLKRGVSDNRILQEIADSDIIGVTSIFSDQETMALKTIKLIRQAFPDKKIITGGVNARNREREFYSAGVDNICGSEGEEFIQRTATGLTPISISKQHLDELPIPAWHLTPLEKYWEIARPHGGHFEAGKKIKYAPMMTSRGCVFSCQYCHNHSNPKRGYRIKSDERVLTEIGILKDLGVEYIYIEDDTFFGYEKRAIRLLNKMKNNGVKFINVNGLNVSHLFQNNQPDIETLEAIKNAGFTEIVLAFESGSQRILKKYASNKWIIEKTPIADLLRLYNEQGITVVGNYMLGFPDETEEEAQSTIQMARYHRSVGLASANLFTVLCLPGTPLFNPKGYNPDMMYWTKGKFEQIRQKAWNELNDADYIKYKKGMTN